MLINARNFESSLADVQGEIEAQVLFDKLHVNFKFLIELQVVFANFPKTSHKHYTMLDMDD